MVLNWEIFFFVFLVSKPMSVKDLCVEAHCLVCNMTVLWRLVTVAVFLFQMSLQTTCCLYNSFKYSRSVSRAKPRASQNLKLYVYSYLQKIVGMSSEISFV